jgi:hypothetical protein
VANAIPVACGSQTSAASSTTYTTTFSVSVPQSATVVVIAGSSGSDTSTGVTDSQGNVYALATSSTTSENVQCWTATAVASLTGGSDTFTVTWTTATTQQKNIIACYVQGAITVDLAATNNGSSGTASVTGGTPVYYSELAIAIVQGASGAQPLGAPVTTTGVPYTLLASEQAASQQITSVYYQFLPRPFAQSVSSSLNASHPWAMLLVSIATVDLAAAPAVPLFLAGYGPQQGDMQALWADPARFYQNRVVFRALQTQALTFLPASGAEEFIHFDTILEDPYGGWNVINPTWFPPFPGWYQVTVTVWMTGPTVTNIALYVYVDSAPAGNPTEGLGITVTNLPAAGGAGEAVWAVYLGPGDSVAAVAAVTGTTGGLNTSLVAGQQSSMEILWLSS